MRDPSELLAQLQVGELLGDAVTRSYLADDRIVGWYGAPGVVIDAEIADQKVPDALAARFAPESAVGFWIAWTRAECGAKLSDVPIMLWLREHGLSEGGHDVETVRLDDLVVSIGFPR